MHHGAPAGVRARGARFATGADLSATQASKRCLLGMFGLLLPIQLLLIVSAIKPMLSVLSDHLGYTGVAALVVYSASAFYFALGLCVLLKFLFTTSPHLDIQLIVLAFLVYIGNSAFICLGLALWALHAAYRDWLRVNALYLAGMSSFDNQAQGQASFDGFSQAGLSLTRRCAISRPASSRRCAFAVV